MRAGLQSQLGRAPCAVGDTEAMFWLREADDYRSRVDLGNALAAQYRFKEAVAAYEKARRIRPDDWRLLLRLAGARLTLRQFDAAMPLYHRCLALGADKKAVSFPLGIGCYLQRDYEAAAAWLEGCLPCDGETAIAVIYWHTLCCLRAGRPAALLGGYRADMEVGHHTAYRLAVSVLCGETPWERAAAVLRGERDDLSAVIGLYGLCGELARRGRSAERDEYLRLLLARDAVWPCISYLAAWNDVNG